jgi:hypothetical protein
LQLGPDLAGAVVEELTQAFVEDARRAAASEVRKCFDTAAGAREVAGDAGAVAADCRAAAPAWQQPLDTAAGTHTSTA